MHVIPGSTVQILAGAVLAAVASLLAWRLRWLKGSGAWAAFGLGFVVFGLGGISWAVVLLTFFITSSLLSLLFKRRKRAAEAGYDKGSQRDVGQVLANGLVAGLFVVGHVFFPDSWLPWTGFAAALAAANADTWATELGVLSKRQPVLISTGKTVAAGTSGAVSLAGTLAAAAGALIIGAAAWSMWPADSIPSAAWWILLIGVCGLLGSFFDSWLGARFQAVYLCPTCEKETERADRHHCGTPTVFLRGQRWLDNDWVNLFCTSIAPIAAILIKYLIKT
jgi:uncharacterized protein (TIGR00297 family)